jgi:hypothetical protein
MSIDPQEFAQLLGADIVGEVPDVGGGPFGMARLARIMHQHLAPSQGERPGRPTNPNWEIRPKVPMSAATAEKLAAIAKALSTPRRKVSAMQVAAQLLEEAIGRVGLSEALQHAPPERPDRVRSVKHRKVPKKGQTPDNRNDLRSRQSSRPRNTA